MTDIGKFRAVDPTDLREFTCAGDAFAQKAASRDLQTCLQHNNAASDMYIGMNALDRYAHPPSILQDSEPTAREPMTANVPNVIVSPATPSPTQAGEFMPRRRFQKGHIYVRNKRRPHWVGSYREDTTLSDGIPKRSRRTVKLGPVSSMSKRSAMAAFQKYLDRVNVFIAPSPKSGIVLKDFIPEWLTQVAVHQAAIQTRINKGT